MHLLRADVFDVESRDKDRKIEMANKVQLRLYLMSFPLLLTLYYFILNFDPPIKLLLFQMFPTLRRNLATLITGLRLQVKFAKPSVQ